jgi:phage gpG-like protein
MKNFLKKINNLTHIGPEILQEIGPFVVASIQENINNAKGPNAALTKELKGDKGPLKDTGELRNSITYRVYGTTLDVGSPLKKAPFLHHGDIITPKKAKKLALPATKKVAKWTNIKGVRGFLEMLKNKGWFILFKEKSIIGFPKHKDMIYGKPLKSKKSKKSKKPKPQLLFYRKDSVTVPEYPFMKINKAQAKDITQIANDLIRDKIS